MELDAVHRQRPVAQPHDRVVIDRARGHFEFRRQAVLGDDERTLTGMYLGENGEWHEMVKMRYQRTA